VVVGIIANGEDPCRCIHDFGDINAYGMTSTAPTWAHLTSRCDPH
jgi:hypothetical protein